MQVSMLRHTPDGIGKRESLSGTVGKTASRARAAAGGHRDASCGLQPISLSGH